MPPPAAPAPGALGAEQARRSHGSFRSWLLGRLDSLLAERLLQAPSSELTRARVLVGTTSVLCLCSVIYTLPLLLAPEPWTWGLPGIVAMLGFLGTLVLLRRATTTLLPAMLLCSTLIVGSLMTILLYQDAYSSTHAATMLVPALAVYLMGPRPALILALIQILLMGLVVLLLQLHFGLKTLPPDPQLLWMLYFAACASVLGIWVLGALHSTARDAAQATLERTLKELHDSERKLHSVFENTDDLVCSTDAEGRLLVANTAMRRAFARYFGKEPTPGLLLLASAELKRQELWAQRFRQVLTGERLRFEVELAPGEHRVVLDTSMGPIPGEDGRPVGTVLFSRDITARKEAETRLGEMHRTLVDVSRQAGMAEIATGVLHNVGNTLNSVNISAHLVTEELRKLRISGLGKAVELLEEHAEDLCAFLTTEPRGRQLPAYLRALHEQLGQAQQALLKEMDTLNESVDHIKSIISMQQRHARTVGAVESLSVPQLIDEALRLHTGSFESLGITLERSYGEVPSLVADRHKLLQILMNLLNNARQALAERPGPDKRVHIRVGRSPDGEHLFISVSDNGPGIVPEHLTRIFTQGFTTKKEGHGFGLHISALSATEMKGRLTCTSLGLGQGASFTLELPLADTKPGA